MKKQLKKVSAWIMALVIALQFMPMTTYAAPLSDEEVVYTFTNEDVLYAAQRAYENGDLTEEQMTTVWRLLSTRLGIQGENKVVVVGYTATTYTYDYYLNNVTWSIVLALGGSAAAALLGLIPGIPSLVVDIIIAAGGAATGTILSAERGVIITVRMVDISLGIGAPQYVYEYVGIREQ